MKIMESVSRSVWLDELYPLPQRLLPQPWEDLASFISRIAVLMGYKHPRWLLRPEAISHRIPIHAVGILHRKRDYELLERLLRVEEESLYNLTFHRFAPYLQAPEFTQPSVDVEEEIQRPFLASSTLSKFISPYSATKVCPRCLAEKPVYGRLYWNLDPIVSCLKHRVFLVQRCPECHQPIPLLRSSLVSCPHCKKGDYRHATVHRLPDDPYFLAGQRWILRLLEIENKEQEKTYEDRISSSLQELSAWQYFRLLDAFHSVLNPLFPDHPFLRTFVDFPFSMRPLNQRTRELLCSEWVTFISTFHFVFASWPSHFFELLGHLSSVKGRSSNGVGISQDYGVFYTGWLYDRLKDRSFSFLREAFEDYIKRKYRGGTVNSTLRPFRGMKIEIMQGRSYVTKRQAMKMLGVGENTLLTLVSRGSLRMQKKAIGKGGKKSYMFFEKVDIEALLQEWEDLLPLDTVAQSYLGTSRENALDLVNTGLVIPTRGPHIDQHYMWFYKKEDIEYFSANLLSLTKRETNIAGELVTLLKASLSTQMTLTKIVVEILEGRLSPVDTGKDEPLFQRIVLRRSEVKQILEERERNRRDSQGLLKAREAATRIGVSYDVLLRWVGLGLLEKEHPVSGGRKNIILLREEAVNAFHQTYTFSQEVGDQLGVELSTVISCIKQGTLHLVEEQKTGWERSVFLLLRKEVDSQRDLILQAEKMLTSQPKTFLRPAMSLTVREAAEQLCFSVASVYHLIYTGEIPYVQSNSAAKSIYILSADLEQYRQKLIQHASSRGNRPCYSSDLTDVEWAELQSLFLPSRPGDRRNPYDIREILNAALYILQRNRAWNQLPDHFPPWKTVNEKFNQWRKTGKWEQIQRILHESIECRDGMECTRIELSKD